MRRSFFGTRFPPKSPVVPSSPVLVYIFMVQFYQKRGV